MISGVVLCGLRGMLQAVFRPEIRQAGINTFLFYEILFEMTVFIRHVNIFLLRIQKRIFMALDKKIFCLLLFLILQAVLIPAAAQFGQPRSKGGTEASLEKRFYIGGGLGFGMSSYSTLLMVAPVVGYRLTPDIDIGTRLNYTYYRYNEATLKYSTNNFGAGVFARYYLFFFSDLFAHAEYEVLNYEQVYVNANWEVDHKERIWVSSMFLGGGYRQWFGQHAFVELVVLFNLLDSIDSPYSNPIFRIGVGVGL
jgi:hypothetical protein